MIKVFRNHFWSDLFCDYCTCVCWSFSMLKPSCACRCLKASKYMWMGISLYGKGESAVEALERAFAIVRSLLLVIIALTQFGRSVPCKF